MNCEECELLLAQNDVSSQVDAHVAGCPNCRALAAELQANAHALRALGEEMMPPLTVPERGIPWWKWTSAAAALIITAGAAWWASRPVKPPQIVSVDVKVTGIVAQAKVQPIPSVIPETLTPRIVPAVQVAQTEPLRVKMLTPDPDVVIYWLVD
ncbi:MAG: hypothetical protein LAO55_12250 [Acidobacteriia bacterium]|nr:hypothetical protein [Terriglobia bacterium]